MGRQLQYQRTDKAIVDAFIRLCAKYDFEEVTIQMILEEALVSRNTFYFHYRDKYEIAEKLFQEFIDDFNAFLIEFYDRDKMLLASLSKEKKAAEFLKRKQEFSAEHAAVFTALCHINTGDLSLSKAFEKLFSGRYLQNPLNQTHGDRCRLESCVYAGIQASICEYYIASDSINPVDNEADMDAVMYAALYALGIHNPEYVKAAADDIRKYRTLEAANPEVYH